MYQNNPISKCLFIINAYELSPSPYRLPAQAEPADSWPDRACPSILLCPGIVG